MNYICFPVHANQKSLYRPGPGIIENHSRGQQLMDTPNWEITVVVDNRPTCDPGPPPAPWGQFNVAASRYTTAHLKMLPWVCGVRALGLYHVQSARRESSSEACDCSITRLFLVLLRLCYSITRAGRPTQQLVHILDVLYRTLVSQLVRSDEPLSALF